MIQTWLPLPSFAESVAHLKNEHLGVQRLHVLEILEYFHDPEDSQLPYGYQNHALDDHPILDMWRGYELQLCEYGLEACEEWARRKNKRIDPFYDKIGLHMEWANTDEAFMHKPNWFGDVDFHISHQAALLRLDKSWYSVYFKADTDRSVVWPESDFRAT